MVRPGIVLADEIQTDKRGFAKAGNEMLWTAYRQGYPYMAICNDDIEYMNKGWWQGIKDTFAMNDKILLAAPMSPKEGGWGYGLTGENNDTWIPPKGFLLRNQRLFCYFLFFYP